MGQLSVTFVTSCVVLLTYYLVMFSVFVSATPLSPPNQPERVDDQPVQFNSDSNRMEPPNAVVGIGAGGGGRILKPFSLAYNRFYRTLRAPFSNSIGQRLLQAVSSYSHGKSQPLEIDLLTDDDDFIDKSKRYDDYGHMRFGKRAGDDHFDDYGHMRFGKRGGSE